MLHSYRFKNFQSFRDMQEVSLVMGGRSPARSWTRTTKSGARVSLALAVFGANAAGKTGLLKPLGFASWFIASSFQLSADSKIPVTPHAFDLHEPFEIEIDAETDEGVMLRYRLVATTDRVIHESIHRKKVRYGYVFTRDWDPKSNSYEIRQQGFGLSPSEASKVRQNASLVSTAAQYGVDVNEYLSAFATVISNFNTRGRLPSLQRVLQDQAFEIYAKDDQIRERMVDLLRQWDLGLSDIELEEVEATGALSERKKWTWTGIHRDESGRTFKLPMESESSGTQSAFVLLARLLSALGAGGIALIDEMESDLHPLLVTPMLELFSDETTNPFGAQVIFTCHSLSVLDLLQKSQVMFVEKNACASEAYRGDEIEGLRSDDNLRAKYESGALGAIPRT